MHPAPPPGPPNPAKHSRHDSPLPSANNPCWNSSDRTYANITPCSPRITVIGPSYPIAQSTLDEIRTGKDDKETDEKPIFPLAPPCPVFSYDKPVFLVWAIFVPPRSCTSDLASLRGTRQHQGPADAKREDDGIANGRRNEPLTFTLPDAQIFATWDFEAKRPQESLVVRGGRGVPASGV
ncbi:hypothetical protein DFH29DRAFT_872344 [Suillus ampliporus]|nr:hypothetical protein DFH29DRAFT_872344 [Suillus ampliporus]